MELMHTHVFYRFVLMHKVVSELCFNKQYIKTLFTGYALKCLQYSVSTKGYAYHLMNNFVFRLQINKANDNKHGFYLT